MTDDPRPPEGEPEPEPEAEEVGFREAEVLAARRESLTRLEAAGIPPFALGFPQDTWAADVAQEFGDRLEPGEESDRRASVAGRVVLARRLGKLTFLVIRDRTGDLQLFCEQDTLGDAYALLEEIDLGDIVGAAGVVVRTKRGELSLKVDALTMLTKTLRPLPDKWHGLKDPDLQQRRRYLHLIADETPRRYFLARAEVLRTIRAVLHEQGYVEFEGPVLQSVAGGANARPFTTHHATLDVPMKLRISLELYLKRMLVGGIERVYEIGRNFRNEGIDRDHNPEFTMLEAYQAYGDYGTMMDLTERLIVGAAESAVAGSVVPWGEKSIDFTPPFARRTYYELFAEHTGIDPADDLAVARLATEIGFETTGKHPDVIRNEIFEERVEDQLRGPIFVIDYPASICPLTKRKRGNPALAERFELFVEGMEIANAYTELNDPDLQEELFRTQLAGQRDEDSMAKMDHDFVRALRHGMPPAGGLGLGIDRLVMLLTNSASIRDVVLFPLMRHES